MAQQPPMRTHRLFCAKIKLFASVPRSGREFEVVERRRRWDQEVREKATSPDESQQHGTTTGLCIRDYAFQDTLSHNFSRRKPFEGLLGWRGFHHQLVSVSPYREASQVTSEAR